MLRRVRLMVVCGGLAAVAATVASGSPYAVRHRPSSITLQWVGDIALSTERGLPPGGLAHALAPVARLLHGADLTLGNLEGTLSVGGVSKCASIGPGNCFAFQAPPSTGFALRALGFRLVNQANNHSMDYGPSGRARTVAALRAAGSRRPGSPGSSPCWR